MSTTSTDLERVPDAPAMVPAASPTVNDDTMAMLWREAKALAAGGMFKDVTQAEQAFAKMVVGHHLGLHPAQSMMGIDIVKGNAQLRGVLMGTLVREREGYDWKVVSMSNEGVSIEFFRDGESQGVSTWTPEDSKRAELDKPSSGGTPSNHVRYPMAMFWNRAMSQGVKLLVPETMRGIPVYVAEDLEGLPSGGARDGEPGAAIEESSAMSTARIELAIQAHIPADQQSRAFDVLSEMNRLAPGSWSASKIEMVFAGKTPYAVSAELASVQGQIEELREGAARAQARESAASEETVPDTGPDADPGEQPAAPASDSATSDEAQDGEPVDGEPVQVERSPEEETALLRIADLEDALAADKEGVEALSEQERADIDAELDSLRGALPPEVNPGQGELPV